MHIIHEEIGFPRILTEKKEGNTAIFTISPLPSGFGMTIGNALRRVLLSSVPGAAITAVRVDGVTHEYTTISGMKDSILNLVLNLKRVALSKDSKEPVIIALEHKGEGDVLAKSIKASNDIKILNPELVITTLDKKSSKLNIEMRIEKGVGYSPASERQKNEEETGWILMDAIFSPVINVQYEVNAVRVGQMTNLDKLTIKVETNGCLSPEDAVKFSAKMLESYFALFQKDQDEFIEKDFIADFDAQKTSSEKNSGEEEKETYTPVEILNLSPRTLNALINGDIGSIEELVQCSEDKLDTLRGFGKKAMDEVKEALSSRGLKLLNL